MRKLFLILAMLPLLAIGQLNYNVYKFSDEATAVQTLDDNGFEYETLKTDFQISKDGVSLDIHFSGQIVTNYPVTDSLWVAEYSSEVYVLVATQEEIDLPPLNKISGDERRYYYDYICKFSGETMD